MILSDIVANQVFTIKKIEDESARAQLIRLGIYEGASFKCIHKIKDGPLIVDANGLDIAIGDELAKKIIILTNTGNIQIS